MGEEARHGQGTQPRRGRKKGLLEEEATGLSILGALVVTVLTAGRARPES